MTDTNAIKWLRTQGVECDVLTYDFTKVGADLAAEAVDRPLEMVCKTLIVRVSGHAFWVAIVPGDQRFDTRHMAAAVGVSRRALELAFRNTLDISPYNFLRLNRFNRLHRELRSTERNSTTVTQLALRCGFTELGRASGEYKRLFGEYPSTTLADEGRRTAIRLADVVWSSDTPKSTVVKPTRTQSGYSDLVSK